METIGQNKVFIILVILFLFENTLLAVNHPKLFKPYTEHELVVSKFYNWYISDIYLKKRIENPFPTLYASGTYQLDQIETFEYLRNTGYFSSQYFGEMEKVYYFCNIQLATVNVKNVEIGGGSPSEDLRDCDFLNTYPWIGGMGEAVSGYEIIDSSIAIGDPNRASVLVRFYPFPSYASVDLDQKDGKWQISNIDVLFYDCGEGWRVPHKREKDVPTYLPADYEP